ncbi:hypothetical protein GCM10027418_29050 [Mariniluteicoccus endophyticus]
MPNLGPVELLIILAVVLLLFGGSRLAGLGKSSGRAIREFKEETRGLNAEDQKKADQAKAVGSTQADRPAADTGVVDAEVVDRDPDDLR